MKLVILKSLLEIVKNSKFSKNVINMQKVCLNGMNIPSAEC